ncbi:hypothetical protein DL96DRAFT_1687686 [Flagelloscypha sp. PMI_526]|nr:hypothetical protein DL96DRAFT_1687686 [Flagelloscypha sp. PMI_526]
MPLTGKLREVQWQMQPCTTERRKNLLFPTFLAGRTEHAHAWVASTQRQACFSANSNSAQDLLEEGELGWTPAYCGNKPAPMVSEGKHMSSGFFCFTPIRIPSKKKKSFKVEETKSWIEKEFIPDHRQTSCSPSQQGLGDATPLVFSNLDPSPGFSRMSSPANNISIPRTRQEHLTQNQMEKKATLEH